MGAQRKGSRIKSDRACVGLFEGARIENTPSSKYRRIEASYEKKDAKHTKKKGINSLFFYLIVWAISCAVIYTLFVWVNGTNTTIFTFFIFILIQPQLFNNLFFFEGL